MSHAMLVVNNTTHVQMIARNTKSHKAVPTVAANTVLALAVGITVVIHQAVMIRRVMMKLQRVADRVVQLLLWAKPMRSNVGFV